jgi:hypothetical protein
MAVSTVVLYVLLLFVLSTIQCELMLEIYTVRLNTEHLQLYLRMALLASFVITFSKKKYKRETKILADYDGKLGTDLDLLVEVSKRSWQREFGGSSFRRTGSTLTRLK